jgi:hypothetical protein
MSNYTIAADGKSITCHDCGMTSYNLKDVEYKFCGKCSKFHEGYVSAISIWTIYKHPADFPGKFVVREWLVTASRATGILAQATRAAMPCLECSVADTLEAARRFIPAGAVNMGRLMETDPCIVESWL